LILEKQNNRERLGTLFSKDFLISQKSVPKHTFIFFAHGAADHFVPTSLDDRKVWGDAIANDVKKIKKLARSCSSCNVVILHIQRGGSHWYTSKSQYATYLRVYSGGKKLITRYVSLLNGADDETLSTLLTYSQKWFPQTHLHLIYRGHSFFPDYVPHLENDFISPFDYNFPHFPYGVSIFKRGIQKAQLPGGLLASITFAACSMKQPEVLKELIPSCTKQVIATEEDVDESLSKGFSYDFLSQVNNSDSDTEVAQKIVTTYNSTVICRQ
jgi:hypothetical protein